MSGQIIPGDCLVALLLAQGTACVAAGLAVSYLLRRHPARAHQILLLALAASLLMPASYLLVRHFELGVLALPSSAPIEVDLPVIAGTSVVASPVEEFDSDSAEIAFADTPLLVPVTQAEDSPLPWTSIVLALWATASVILAGRVLLQFVLGLGLVRAGEPLETECVQKALEIAKARIGIRGPVVIRSSPKIHSPVIWCWSHVPVLLVQEADEATSNDCDWAGVFCHELAHLKRRDHLSGLFAELLAAAIPWHPLPWWARERLSQLSEEACDDWVLAGGRSGVDYAESLLSLSPQRRVSFLPTVVGKERTMKARIYRIVRDQCSDPRIGRRWAFSLCALAVLVIATVALAQPQPEPAQAPEPVVEPETVQPAPPQGPAVAGRRNVLQWMLDQLVAQAEETEAALRRRGDQPGEETEVLRLELLTLRDQIGRIERQLRDLDQSPRLAPPRRPTLEITQPRQSEDALRDLQSRQERIQRRLDEIRDPDSEEARELREQLARLDVQIRQAEARVRAARARREAISRAPQREGRSREPDDRVRNLRNRLLELEEQNAEKRRSLQQSDDPDSEESRDRRAALEQSERERADVREELDRLDPDLKAWELERDLRVNEEFLSTIARRIALHEPELFDLEQQGRSDTAEATELRQNLARLHSQARALEARIEAQRRDLSHLRTERDPDTRRTEQRATSPYGIGPYGDAYARATTRARIASPQASPDVQRQVEELRGQVNGLNDQMKEMREMLRQLLERRSEADDKPQEMKRY
ncbi:MAG: M56 family metallopeptidase [Sedimentisphaerales bacterium]|jgi:beta-lactamase regulating signal transducer with metallopeptidase domain/uncharacterized coiled-coil DUF342 family protein|nr:M56 family metallopeptidase [Sedimentisphaerales bacterium]HNY77444.1 M56 family metallopeptidase [Sedimentisphaerales bacterium]HOC62848.1 M56 family metallopeptidase [Sedimentisphaerales bacterium]HOH63666.1 M56 family metallopeptidase [Sedimentisphaerales bacterium]HPY49813.1 M56 family metallopeptidase [Sedimentisphaerales bacterium]